jgi:ubiquinone/menaquinone biosynthesis C-methylase UbiE
MKSNILTPDSVREQVRQRYGQVASSAAPCCGGGNGIANTSAEVLGYSAQEAGAAPAGANLGLGCGNPLGIALLQPGETVLDLGSGAGFDCFLAARAVGENGRVIGVDMTPEMLAKARANATKVDARNIEFRLGEIEALPVADDSVDAVISNCVVNLSPDKPRVFREVFRALKPGGRVAIADIVRTAELPLEVRSSLDAHCGCVAGAASIAETEAMLREAGFAGIRVVPKDESRAFIREWVAGSDAADYVVSATVMAIKPEHE